MFTAGVGCCSSGASVVAGNAAGGTAVVLMQQFLLSGPGICHGPFDQASELDNNKAAERNNSLQFLDLTSAFLPGSYHIHRSQCSDPALSSGGQI
ncbi:unnamed protein product [Phytophthora fragariaefolia]|uniref:Unnamed protein product n=1 Tax=Phytophthora fragariaefolia TaxID=1490495 RepID=A0A9W6XLY0_9STRA|nr:unnamed protein product [Phytophthora fragariaefolia]